MTDSLSDDGFLLDVTVVVVGTASVKLVVATAPDAPVALTLYVATNQSGRLNESLMCLVLPLITEVLGSHILGSPHKSQPILSPLLYIAVSYPGYRSSTG